MVDTIAATIKIYNIVSPKHSTINFHKGVNSFTIGKLAPYLFLNVIAYSSSSTPRYTYKLIDTFKST